ncbi:MAG TPA: class I SAM-dependent methyltransferase [Blastocatellia bacterium]|nr:class I SAM-dependent methyltransferase [Blastocatellia bacterium]
MTRSFFLCLISLAGAVAIAMSQQLKPQARFLTYEEARPLLQSLDEILPAELKGKSAEEGARGWPEWVKAQDAAVRARLRRGDEDTMINFLLFGASFTRQPRVTAQELTGRRQAQEAFNQLINARIDDLIRALTAPKAVAINERLGFLRKLVAQQGHQLDDPKGRAKLREYLLAGLQRTLREQESYAQALAAARSQGNPGEEFIERSKLYRTRGLSLDTALAPNFAIEESLKAMKSRGLIQAGSVRKVAVIGPGLDFTDKAAGYDFYPEQTIQPFALIDSLERLGLAKAGESQLVAFDLSPRALDHLARARGRAQRGLAYVVQLPHDPQAKWRPELLRYWETFGDQIGKPAAPVGAPAGLSELKLRAVRVAPSVVARVRPVDLNIVYQRMAERQNFDLIIATNVLVYYDVFEQSLAMANIESLLRPGGFLLSNNALLELPVSGMKSVDYLTVVYSDRPDDGDHIVWYQRAPARQ